VLRRAEFRRRFVREAWTMTKRFGTEAVRNIELGEIQFLDRAVAEGYVEDPQRLVLAALVGGLRCRTFFEIGTNRGRTTWTVARSNPDLTLYTLDVPIGQAPEATRFALHDVDRMVFRDSSCGEAFRETAEGERITQLWGDSATFDFSPYAGTIDCVYIDGSHAYEYAGSDTAAALEMLSPYGAIVWDDYGNFPGVYRAVLEFAHEHEHPVYHLFGTRYAVYSRTPLMAPAL
jgi:predicted O-methyltransferase YrrM